MPLWVFVGTGTQTRNHNQSLLSTTNAPTTCFCLSDHLGYPALGNLFLSEKGGGPSLLPDFSPPTRSTPHEIMKFQHFNISTMLNSSRIWKFLTYIFISSGTESNSIQSLIFFFIFDYWHTFSIIILNNAHVQECSFCIFGTSCVFGHSYISSIESYIFFKLSMA